MTALVKSEKYIQNFSALLFTNGPASGAKKASGKKVTASRREVPIAPFPSKIKNHKIELKAKQSAEILMILEKKRNVKFFFQTLISPFFFLHLQCPFFIAA